LFVATAITPSIVQQFTLPRAFPQLVVEDLDREYEGGQLELVVFRGPMLGEMLRMALRRGDSLSVQTTLEAIGDYQRAYLRARAREPGIRTFVTEGGATRAGWLAADLCPALVSAGEDALRLGGAGHDLNEIARVLAAMGSAFDAVGDTDDVSECIDALTSLATTHTQVSAATLNIFAEPVGQLAWLEGDAEQRGEPCCCRPRTRGLGARRGVRALPPRA